MIIDVELWIQKADHKVLWDFFNYKKGKLVPQPLHCSWVNYTLLQQS